MLRSTEALVGILIASSPATNPCNKNPSECDQHHPPLNNRGDSTISPNRVRLLSTWFSYKTYWGKTYGATHSKRVFTQVDSSLNYQPALFSSNATLNTAANMRNPTTLPLHPMARVHDYRFRGSSTHHQCRRDRIFGHRQPECFSTCFMFIIVQSSWRKGSVEIRVRVDE